jgi:class 3 adenylate cyclase
LPIYVHHPSARSHHPAKGGTDIVGYTALMGNDEQKAFAILDKNRALQKPIIEQFNGRWIKELGDGVMASFVVSFVLRGCT